MSNCIIFICVGCFSPLSSLFMRHLLLCDPLLVLVFFTRAQRNLRRVSSPSMQSNVTVNQANAISQSLLQNMQHEKKSWMQ